MRMRIYAYILKFSLFALWDTRAALEPRPMRMWGWAVAYLPEGARGARSLGAGF